jgi:hypothetical protein
MNMMNSKDTSTSRAEIERRIAFLNYLSDFLQEATHMSEALKLRQVAYFLSMAKVETNDQLAAMQVHRELQLAIELAKKIT